MRAKRALVAAQLVALLVGTVAIGRPAYRWIKRSVAEAQAVAEWGAWQADPMNAERPPASGEPALWLRVPSAGVDSLVLFDASEENLQLHPCVHDGGGSARGRPTVIMAHRDYHFRKLEALEIDARLEVEDAAGERQRDRIRDIEVIEIDEVEETIERGRGYGAPLALLTCYPFEFVGPAPQRILFWAERLPVAPKISRTALGDDGSEIRLQCQHRFRTGRGRQAITGEF